MQSCSRSRVQSSIQACSEAEPVAIDLATRSSVASLDCSCIIKSSASQIDRVRDTAWCQCDKPVQRSLIALPAQQATE